MNYHIPFNKPFTVGPELDYIAEAVRRGRISGDGAFSKKCQALIETVTGAEKVLLTHSCTAALEMSAILCGIGENDEVIVPSFTFVSTANAFRARGARLRFVDIRPDSLNIDEEKIEASVSGATKAVVPVHYAGVACEMETILDIAARRGLFVIEDAALAMGSWYEDRHLGTLGDFGAFSFHETKSVICGEGGALLINRADHVDRAEIIREKGTNRSRFFRGEVDHYTWVDAGSSYLPSEITAAYLLAQLENMERTGERFRVIHAYYHQALTPLMEDGLLTLPHAGDHRNTRNNMFYVLLETRARRDALLAFLQERGILAVFHYVPLHLSPMGRAMGYEPGSLPVTEDVSGRLLRLPFYFDLSRPQQDEVVSRIMEFYGCE